jgi:hypothetical protein
MFVMMLTARQVAAEVSEQALVAVTQTLPPVAFAFTTIAAVPCPLTMVQPVGTVQAYDIAPGTVAAE